MLLLLAHKCGHNEIEFSGLAHEGLTEVPVECMPAARVAVTIAKELGIFRCRPTDTTRMLKAREMLISEIASRLSSNSVRGVPQYPNGSLRPRCFGREAYAVPECACSNDPLTVLPLGG